MSLLLPAATGKLFQFGKRIRQDQRPLFYAFAIEVDHAESFPVLFSSVASDHVTQLKDTTGDDLPGVLTAAALQRIRPQS